jgi:hypothetical protein
LFSPLALRHLFFHRKNTSTVRALTNRRGKQATMGKRGPAPKPQP